MTFAALPILGNKFLCLPDFLQDRILISGLQWYNHRLYILCNLDGKLNF